MLRGGVAIRAFLSADPILDASDIAAIRTTLSVPQSRALQPGDPIAGRFVAEVTVNPRVTPHLIVGVDTESVVVETDETNNEAATEIESSRGARFRRADTNVDGRVNLADANGLLGFLFRGDTAPRCPDAADANDDNSLNLADVTTILGWLSRGGKAPAAPEPFECGEDSTPAGLRECGYECP